MEPFADALTTFKQLSNPEEQPDNSTSRMSSAITSDAFQSLVERIHSCHFCPRMEGRTRVFGSANGPTNAKILFVAEAPGRLGADRLGIPLSGDQTGRNFDILLQAAQLDRQALFITNAVLCNPRDDQGHNAPPIRQEIENCSNHLRKTIAILQPRYVITLGQVALHALRLVVKHEVILAQHVGCPQKWNERWLIALYHPGSRARIYRPLDLQTEDFRRLGIFINSGQ